MRCENCKKNTATIHLTELVDGVRNETHLCELCAHKQGLAVKNQIPLSELLSTLLASQDEGNSLTTDSDERTCPHCGITFEDFRKKAVLGCPNDYEVFRDLLETILEATHGGKTVHCGKIPANMPAGVPEPTELEVLQKELDAAIRNEDYETAAQLRDKIIELQGA
ncbi:MAG: UvrB/UvrC motif-containing protein [Planctomycetota bacterium]